MLNHQNWSRKTENSQKAQKPTNDPCESYSLRTNPRCSSPRSLNLQNLPNVVTALWATESSLVTLAWRPHFWTNGKMYMEKPFRGSMGCCQSMLESLIHSFMEIPIQMITRWWPCATLGVYVTNWSGKWTDYRIENACSKWQFRITKPIFNFIKLKSIPGLLMIHVTFIADLLYLSIFYSFMYITDFSLYWNKILQFLVSIGETFHFHTVKGHTVPHSSPHLTTPLLPRDEFTARRWVKVEPRFLSLDHAPGLRTLKFSA